MTRLISRSGSGRRASWCCGLRPWRSLSSARPRASCARRADPRGFGERRGRDCVPCPSGCSPARPSPIHPSSPKPTRSGGYRGPRAASSQGPGSRWSRCWRDPAAGMTG